MYNLGMQKRLKRHQAKLTRRRAVHFDGESSALSYHGANHRGGGCSRIVLKVLLGTLVVVALAAGVWALASWWGARSVQPATEVATEPEPVVEDYYASLFMVGDALIHDTVYNFAAAGTTGEDGLPVYDFKPMLAQIKPISERYDLSYYNQETVLGGTALGLSSYPRFNSPYEVGDAFRDAGFNLVSLATNHTMDRGAKGVENSLAYWQQYQDEVYFDGSATSFAERDVVDVREVNGISYAFLAYTMWNNGLATPSGQEYLNNEWNEELARAQVEAVRDQVDIVIVAMHWGTEYAHEPSATQRQAAEFLHDLGVDIIIGAHPHVVQPIDVLSTPIATEAVEPAPGDSVADSTPDGVTSETGGSGGTASETSESKDTVADSTSGAVGSDDSAESSSVRGWVEDGQKKTLVIYSLGNFISDQAGIERLTGLMASTQIHKHVEGDTVTLSVAPVHAELIYTKRDRAARTFVVYPYSQLNETLLPGYINYQTQFERIVNQYGEAEFVVLADDEYVTESGEFTE